MGLREVLHDNLHDDHFDKGVSVPGKYTTKSAVPWDTAVPNAIVTGSDGEIYFLAAGKDPAVNPVGDTGENWATLGQTPLLYPLSLMTNPVWVKMSNNPVPPVADYISRDITQHNGETFHYAMQDKTADKRGELKVWHADGSSNLLMNSGVGSSSTGLTLLASIVNKEQSSSDLYAFHNETAALSGYIISRYDQETRAFTSHITNFYTEPNAATITLFDFDGLLGLLVSSASGTTVYRQDIPGGIAMNLIQTIPSIYGGSAAGIVNGRVTICIPTVANTTREIWCFNNNSGLFEKTDTFSVSEISGGAGSFISTGSGDYLTFDLKVQNSHVYTLKGGKIELAKDMGAASKKIMVCEVDGVTFFASQASNKVVMPLNHSIVDLPSDPGGQGEGVPFSQGGYLAKIVDDNYYRLEFS